MRSGFIPASDPWTNLTPSEENENREQLPGLTGALYMLSAPSGFDCEDSLDYLYS
jgi:hypothetical protein